MMMPTTRASAQMHLELIATNDNFDESDNDDAD